ncbi:hypothetical protein BLNAU_22783 [Blattamonas nauphoetae]|uniref:Uncharacterized protein n=1 Tax=Blattamonas nauphoetae TaxID=2049346 RepID=A0ABQ9WS25_9EUKA|nr:hypothetical protein BLNAU_22783 [Blattamonas nauphoetae]
MAQHIKPTSVTDLLLDRVISPSNQPYDDVPDDHTHLPFSRSSSLPRTRLSNTPQRTRSHSTQYSSRLPPRPPNTIRRPQRTILSPNSSHGDSPTTLHHPSKRLPSPRPRSIRTKKEEAEKKIAKQAERPTTKAAISTKKQKQSIQPESRSKSTWKEILGQLNPFKFIHSLKKTKQQPSTRNITDTLCNPIVVNSNHSNHSQHESSNKSPHPPSIPLTHFGGKEKNSKREEANVHAGQVSENKEDTKEDNGNDIIRKIKRRQSEPPEVVNNLKPVESKRDRKKDEEDHTSESPSPTFSYLMSLCQNKESLTPPPSPNSTGTDSTPKNDEKISIDLPSPPAISGPQNEGMISERTLKVSIKAQMRVRERGIAKLRERHLTRLGQPQTSRRGLQKSKRVSKPHQNNKTKKKPGRKPEKKTIPADTTPHDKLHVPNDSQILFTSNNQINQNISFFYPTHPLDYTQTRQQSSPPIDIDSTASFLPKPQPSRDIMQDNEMINSVGEWFALHPMETHPTGKWTSHDDHSRNLNQVTREVDEIYSKSFPHFPHLSHWLPIETLFTISSQTTKKELPPDFFNLMSKRIKDLTDAQWDTLRRHSVCIQPSPIIDHQKIIGQIERNIRDDPSSVMDLPSHIFDHFRRSLHAPKRKRQSKKTIDINFGIDTAISRFPRSQPAGADTTMLEIHNPANSSSPPIDINFGTDTVISPFPRLQPAGADTTMLEIHNPANSSSPPIDINFGIDTAISPFPRLQPAGADTTMLEMHNPANSSSPPIDINFGIDTAISPFPRLQPAGADTTMLEIHIPANSSSPSTFAAEISRPRPILAAYSPPMPISKTKTGMASMHLPIKRNSSLLSSAEARDTRNTARQELVGEQSINDRDRERLAVAKGNQLGLTEKCRLLVRRMNQFDCIHLNTIRNDLTLGTDELRPRRAERWSAQKMNQFNILTTTPIEMLFPVVGLGTTLPLDNQTLKKSIIQLSEDEASHIENLLTKTVMKKFSVVNAWKSLAGPEAIGLKRDNPSNLARQKRAEYSEARERFDITNTFNMPAKHHHPISFQRANTPPLEEIQTLISLPFDPFDGYTRWDADLSTRHLRKAKDALKQTFSDLLTTLSAPNPDLMSANVIAGKISAIPQTLKGGQKSEYHPPRAETMIHGKTLSKERRNRIETLVGKGKSSSALKELTQLENQTEPPLETILQQIQALHNFEDEKTLQLSPSHHTNKPDKGGEATEIKNALNSLNTNSAPSLDGLTNGDSSQKPGAYAAYAPFKSQMVPTDQ